MAQMSGEKTGGNSTTGTLMRDLSRLHHTGELEEFLSRWQHRSANDYELSEPRFREEPERALRYSTTFAPTTPTPCAAYMLRKAFFFRDACQQ